MQEFPGRRIGETFILEQIDNPNRLSDTINLRVKLRLVDKPEGQVSVGGQIITNLRYTNDTTLVARTSEELLELMKRVKAASEQFKTLPQGGNDYNHDREVVDQVDVFNLLGSMIIKDGGSSVDIRRRLAKTKTKTSTSTLSNIWKDRNIT